MRSILEFFSKSIQCVHVKLSAGRWPLGSVQGFLYMAQ